MKHISIKHALAFLLAILMMVTCAAGLILPTAFAEEPLDGNNKAPAEYVIPDDSLIKTHEVMPDTWVFTDGLGRVSLTNAEVGDPREDKTVSMFFWTWHNGRPTVLNINDIAEKYPEYRGAALRPRP